ncbi:ABC transporter permease [Psychromonas ossibalaenae]|uniref:ABC transporter permease n=1 Tax=Psychromonas ossibalaenae TaxID=444922 RepID=UPI00036E9060|nr:FtsX-like permease family protein [Psychromonas ossibalaenae]
MLLKLAWRNLWRNKLRTSIVLGAMVFGLVGVTLMIGFMNGMMDNMISNAINWQTSHLQVHQKDYSADPEIHKTISRSSQLQVQLDKMTQIKTWASRHLAQGMIASARSTRGITINGIDLQKEALITPLAQNIYDGFWLDDKGRNPILVSKKIAQRLKLRVGSKVVLTFTNKNGDVSGAAFRVRGLFKTPSSAFDEMNVFVRKADLKVLSGIEGDHEIALLVNDIKQLESVKRKIHVALAQSDSVQNWEELQPMLAAMSASMASSNIIILVIFVLAMGFGIVNILLMSVFERTCEFGVLMAVGMQKHKILQLILLESTFLGVVGATLGLLCSLAALSILKVTGISLSSLADGLSAMGLDTLLYPKVSGSDFALIFITVVLASSLAGLYPARQILKQEPAQAMSEKH